eukprot:12926160-Prorocentrum_lima.AAC.1
MQCLTRLLAGLSTRGAPTTCTTLQTACRTASAICRTAPGRGPSMDPLADPLGTNCSGSRFVVSSAHH